MNKIYLILFCLVPAFLFSQNKPNPLAIEVNSWKSHPEGIKEIKPFKTIAEDPKAKEDVLGATYVQIEDVEYSKLWEQHTGAYKLSLPYEGQFINVLLFENTQSRIPINSSEGAFFNLDQGKTFQGIVEGDESSVVGISFFRNGDIYGIISTKEKGNIVVGQLLNQPTGATPTYIIYEENKLKVGNPFTCASADQIPTEDGLSKIIEGLRGENVTINKCVRVGFLVTYPMYNTRFGSNATTATNYVRALSNNMGAIYALHNVHQKIGDIYIFTTAASDTFNYTSTITALESFGWSLPANYMPNSDLFHLLHPGMGGGVAWLNVLCNPVGTYSGRPYDYRTAVSGSLSNAITNVPTYSWNVEVCTHEMGHNLASPHTHACNWNGNNTKIDDCGTSAGYNEGTCPPAPGLPPANTGTVMSYCHLVATGINFAYGFGPQPGDLIDSKVNNAACLVGCCTTGIMTSVVPDTCVTAGTSVTVTASGASVYSWRYDADTYTYGNTFTVTVNRDYYVTVTGYNLGDCVGEQIVRIRLKPAAPTISNLNRTVCQNGSDVIAPTASRICQVLPSVRITELHYDNTGNPDVNEFVEVGGPAGTDLSCYKIYFYNGSTPTAAVLYDSITLSGTIDNENGCGYGAISFLRPNIQNGPADGLALVYLQGATCPDLSDLVEFISYEGTITASNGWAKNLVSKNLPVSEPGSDSPGLSLQLINGTWVGPQTDSRDSLQTSVPCFNFYSTDPALGGAIPFYTGSSLTINSSSSPLNTANPGMFMVWVTNRSAACGQNNTCESAATKLTYTISPLNPTITAAPPTICPGGSSVLTVNGGPFATYSWSTGQSGASITVSPTSTTVYTVTVSDGGLCSGSASVTVTVGAALMPTVTVDPSFICNPAGGNVNVSATAGFLNYTWSSGQSSQSFTQNVTSTTTFTVTVSDGTCTGTGSATVTVGGAITPTITSNPTSPVCAGTTVALGLTSAYSSYTWNTGEVTSTINVAPTATTSYSVTVQDAAGCIGVASITINVNPLPTPTITGNLTICQGQSTTLSTSTTYNTYLWSNGAVTQSIVVSPTVNTTYSVTVTDANLCQGITSATVTVTAPPTVSISATPPSPVCSGVNCTLNTVPSTFTNYLWSTGASSSTINQVMTTTTTFSVTCTNTSGCTAVASYQMVVNPAPASPTFSAADNPLNICQNGIDTIVPMAPRTPPVVPNVIISEFHYDNIGTDANEFIEVAGPAGTNLACYTLQLYNGNTPTAATVYNTLMLSGTIDNEGNGYGAVDFVYPVNGIQNGTTDGIALVYVNGAGCPNPTSVLQFISYEGGAITASGGFANGMNSTPIPVQEDFPVPASGFSLQYDFVSNTWAGPLATTHQGALPLIPPTFKFYSSNPVPGPATAFRMDTILPIGPTTTPINSATPGMYMVWVTTFANGCESVPTKITININAKPVLSAVPTTQAVCSGDFTNIVLNSTIAGTTFTYTVVPTPNSVGASAGVGSPIRQRLTNGTLSPIVVTYKIVGTSPFGCVSDTLSIPVTVNPFSIEEQPRHYCICPGGSVKLIGPLGYTYLWDSGHTGKDTTVTSTGRYNLRISNAYGCPQILTFVVDFAPDFQMTCNDMLNVSLDTNCMAVINWDMVLEGNPPCPDGLSVKITHTDGTINDTLTNLDLGKILKYSVYNCNYNSCWGYLRIEDKVQPKMQCIDTLVLCNVSTSPASTGFPNRLKLGTDITPVSGKANTYTVKTGLIDKCGEVTLRYVDNVQEFNCPDTITKIITRRWVAVDAFGNEIICTQTIKFRRGKITEIVMPKDYDGKTGNNQPLDICNSSYANTVSTSVTGVPTGPLCGMMNYTYKDYKIPTCGNGYTLLREWRLLDWCTGTMLLDTQVIRVVDKTAPVLTCPASITVSTDGLDCMGSGAFPAPKVSDVCSSVSYDVYYNATGSDPLPVNASITKLADGSYRYSGFTCGNYNMRYVATDACGNRSECTGFVMTVRDITVPTAVCRSITEVTLTNTIDDPTTPFKECGLTRVEAYKFDEGSLDNCGPVYFKVKRVVTPGLYDGNANFDDNVYFNCEDVGVEREVILRVYDVQPVGGHVPSDTYKPANVCGANFNDCVVKVNVKDLVNPTLTCPSNITINCNAYDFNIPLTGADTAWFNKYLGKIVTTDCNGVNASSQFTYYTGSFNTTANNGTAFDNCFVNVQQTITSQIDCGIGTISRQFRAVDRGGRTSSPCTQLIYVINNTPFSIDGNQYTDPGNDLADPCDGTERHINYKVDYIKDPIDVSNGLTDPAVTPLTQDDIVWPDQYVEIETCQGKDSIGTSCEKGKGAGFPRFLRNNKCDLLGISYTDEYFPIELPACKKIIRTWTVIDWCQDKPAGRKWTYQQFIKFTNKVAPNFTGNSCKNDTICQYPTDCGPDALTLTATAEDDCTPASNLKYRVVIDLNNNGTVDLTGNGSSVTITKNNGLSYGRHMITWSAEDGCGNVKTCTKTVDVKDCKKPTPVAKLLSVELMPSTCTAVLEASKVNNFSWDNCTPMDKLRFRLAKAGSYSANITLSEVLALDDKITLTKDDFGNPVIALFVIDEQNNFDYVEVFVIVQSNMNPDCGFGGETVGIIGGVKTESGEDVQDVEARVNGTLSGKTGIDGRYGVSVKKGTSGVVLMSKNVNPMNGVSTADLVAINKHILGTQVLTSAYKQIAADVNKDKRVSTADMVELRKMILYLQNDFSNNQSWRLINKGYTFTTTNPLGENYTESYVYNNIQKGEEVNYVGVKIGDVNGSASPNQLISGEERGVGTLMFDAENATVAANETKTVEFKAADIANISGYQFTLNYDKEAIEVMEMGGRDMTANNFGMLMNEGAVTTSFDGKVSSDVVFTMTIKAKKNVQLSDVMSIGSRFTAAEAYSLSGDKLDVALSFNGKEKGGYELYQNQPNPFNGKTVIGFTMPQAGAATISIMDAAGRTVKVVEVNGVKGYNQVILDKSELSTGVLSYRLTTAGFSATKQMIVTE